MPGGLPRASGINASDKFHVLAQIIQHADMLAAHRTVHHGGGRPFGHQPRRSDPDRAVDDCHYRLKAFDVPGGLTDKVLDLERIANVQEIDAFDRLGDGHDVHPDRVVMPGYKLKQWIANLSQSDDDYIAALAHGDSAS
jgi:hypothetical protein